MTDDEQRIIDGIIYRALSDVEILEALLDSLFAEQTAVVVIPAVIRSLARVIKREFPPEQRVGAIMELARNITLALEYV